MASRGLPGFLRRSLRVELSEDEDDEEEISDSSSSSLPPTGTTIENNNNKKQEENINDDFSQEERNNSNEIEENIVKPKSAPAVFGGVSSSGQQPNTSSMEHHTENIGSTSKRSVSVSLPPTNMQIPPQPSSMDRRISEPSISNSGQNDESFHNSHNNVLDNDNEQQDIKSQQQNNKQTSKRTPTYRETQFEKIFAANVVSMNDLRKLAWNGIPVSLLNFVLFFFFLHFC